MTLVSNGLDWWRALRALRGRREEERVRREADAAEEELGWKMMRELSRHPRKPRKIKHFRTSWPTKPPSYQVRDLDIEEYKKSTQEHQEHPCLQILRDHRMGRREIPWPPTHGEIEAMEKSAIPPLRVIVETRGENPEVTELFNPVT